MSKFLLPTENSGYFLSTNYTDYTNFITISTAQLGNFRIR